MYRKCVIPLLTILLWTTLARAEVVVIMRREAQSSGNYVRVCDIARIDGPSDQAREVAMVVLGPAPYQGETREISRWDIEARLFEMGVDARVTFTGNDVVRVFGDGIPERSGYTQDDEVAFQPLYPIPQRGWGSRSSGGSEVAGIDVGRRRGDSQVDSGEGGSRRRNRPVMPPPRPYERQPREGGRQSLTGEARRRIELAVSEYFSGKYKNSRAKREDIEVEAKLLSVTSDIPFSAFDVQVEEAIDGKVPGKATLRVKVKDNENDPFREVMVVADTDVFGDALVASRHLAKGELLEERDVMVTRIRMEGGKGYLPPTPSAAAGREMRVSLKPGQPIIASDAIPGDAVRRGSQVVVENKGKGWMVQTKAKALGAGAVGDVITVEDTGNKSKYQARIIGPGTVTAVLKRDAHGMLEKK